MKLTVTLSGRTLDKYEFDQDSVKIGRAQDCDVPIDNIGVSRYHAEILKRDGVYLLRDLKSNNGTFVNGKKVETYCLNDGDDIALGKFIVSFSGKVRLDLPEPELPRGNDTLDDEETGGEERAEAGPPPGARDEFGVLTMPMDKKALAQAQREKSSKVRGYLIVHEGAKKTNVFLNKAVTVIGQGMGVDVEVKGWFTPKKVAIIFRDESGFRIIDVTRGQNAVSVNGKKTDDARLTENDELRVLGKEIQFMQGTPGVGPSR